ncbi:hypothetical protein E2562_028894 [Oryza meyeriana var. granulata]|uniref:Uncharacterized protein n=1 Tax=Oryza meyeriana var. granulata TaxID=110450 RepID=A0A6G1FD82_9ORYZ|nr:hypothetical protein E2562_032428 [Oryza meyeriana var. granulata]KAF0934896.1 hypothetical protein E2562_028894 [Oryza meyeriana var. granulata]
MGPPAQPMLGVGGVRVNFPSSMILCCCSYRAHRPGDILRLAIVCACATRFGRFGFYYMWPPDWLGEKATTMRVCDEAVVIMVSVQPCSASAH